MEAKDLVGLIGRQPARLGAWRYGRPVLPELLRLAAMRRFECLAVADGPRGAQQVRQDWAHAVSQLVTWAHAHDGALASSDPDWRVLAQAVDLAAKWRPLEAIQAGLATGDMAIARVNRRKVWLVNDRDPRIEVLDIMLEGVSAPPRIPEHADSHRVRAWFDDHQGRPAALHSLPLWLVDIAYEAALERLLVQGTSLDQDTDLGGLTLRQATRCYGLLTAMTEINDTAVFVLENPNALVWHIRPGTLHRLLAARVGHEPAYAFMRLCTFAPGRQPLAAPMIPCGEFLAIPSDLVSPTGFERTLLRSSAQDPTQAGRLGNALGARASRWAQRLRTVPGAEVHEQVVVRTENGRALGDLDLVAMDRAAGIAAVIEAKWPIDAATLSESSKVEAQFDKGRHQLLRLRAALESGASVDPVLRGAFSPGVRTYWFVGSAQQLDSRRQHHDDKIYSTSLRLLEQLMPFSSLEDLVRRLENPPLPKPGVEFEVRQERVTVDGWRISFPAIALDPSMPRLPEERRMHMGWT